MSAASTHRQAWSSAVLSTCLVLSACDPQPEAAADDLIAPVRQGTQCGTTWDAQGVEQYDGTLGVTTDFTRWHEGPVGQLQWRNDLAARYAFPGNVSGVRWCSGTLISADLFLTAGHCFDQAGQWLFPRVNGVPINSAQAASEMVVKFNYQRDPAGTLRQEVSVSINALVENELGGLDFAVLRLGEPVGFRFGSARVADADAALNDPLAIIGHPNGRPKEVDAGSNAGLNGNEIRYGDIDTLGGNSGSGIIHGNTGLLVGVHTTGGCTTTGGNNSGVRIGALRAQSPLVGKVSNARPPLQNAFSALLQRGPTHLEYVTALAILLRDGTQAELERYVRGLRENVQADYDGDGKSDMSAIDVNGAWFVDFAAGGFGIWNQSLSGYGIALAGRAVPADYDGDGKADLSAIDVSGTWFVDFAADGFGIWNQSLTGYGIALAGKLIPADYDGDGKSDMSAIAVDGTWFVDFAADGFGIWNQSLPGYGVSLAGKAVPADYDGDNKADMSAIDVDGAWFVDFAADGFGIWNQSLPGYGIALAGRAVPADYDGDNKADMSAIDVDGTWFVDFAAGGFGVWNQSLPGYGVALDGKAVPADYDGDNKADMSAVAADGTWLVDFAAGGSGIWNQSLPGYGIVLEN